MSDPRYVTGLRDVTDTGCYKDILECNKYEDARDKADLAAEKHQRNTIVFDRKLQEITYRKVVQVETAKIIPPKPLKKKAKEEVKVVAKNKDAYFE